MDLLVPIAIAVLVGFWLYKSGKRTGSKRGYAAGRSRERRRRHRRR